MRKRYVVWNTWPSEHAVKACWTHAGATRWIKRKCARPSQFYVGYER